MRKKRTDIPRDVAARVLFHHDRTCCVCRNRGKPVQVHHLDDDPSNHELDNLAVLCFDCHRDTQIRGGFDRKLDGEQIVLYRDDWIRLVARQRAQNEMTQDQSLGVGGYNLEFATSIAEIYRERGEYELLAIHYDVLGNAELRDKYIDLALQQAPSDEKIAFLRPLQGRPDLIAPEVINRKLQQHDKDRDWEQKGRFLKSLGRYQEAVLAYIRGIQESLEQGRVFGAAYYLKEVVEDELPERMFELALRQAEEHGDLWWQVRALQELRWKAELEELLLKNADEITRSGDLYLKIELASAQGDMAKLLALQKELARSAEVSDEDSDEEGEA